jgi:predicted O-methyltransferase YrrM
MRAYINSLDMGNTPFLEELERFALENEVPIIRKEMQSFMKVLLAVKRPMQVLEVGTAVGFSTLLMCEYGQPNMHITTIENYEKRIPIARENFRKAGKEHRITFLTGDAGEILPTLLGRYDLIFMDAAKGRLLAPGGILLSDNVLQEGELIESHYLVERRNRTIYKRMREYLYELKHHPQLLTSIVPLGDGISLSVKQERGNYEKN